VKKDAEGYIPDDPTKMNSDGFDEFSSNDSSAIELKLHALASQAHHLPSQLDYIECWTIP
jgi:hypothetical protein